MQVLAGAEGVSFLDVPFPRMNRLVASCSSKKLVCYFKKWPDVRWSGAVRSAARAHGAGAAVSPVSPGPGPWPRVPAPAPHSALPALGAVRRVTLGVSLASVSTVELPAELGVPSDLPFSPPHPQVGLIDSFCDASLFSLIIPTSSY